MDIARYISSLTDEADGASRLEPLTGGYWNQVFRYRDESRDWVVKVFNAQGYSPLYPVLPDAEARALDLLSGTGCAPRLVRFDTMTEGNRVLVYEYVKGRPWQGQSREDFVAVGQLLAHLHRIEVDATAFRSLPVTPPEIVEQANAMLMRINSELPERHRLLDLAAGLDMSSSGELEGRVLVHTDCGPGNMIVHQEGLCLIDWQCPGMGDACQDLAVFLSPGIQILYGARPLTEAEASMILEGYAAPLVTTRLARMRIFYHYLIASYCLYRRETLQFSQPENSATYDKALAAELELLQELVP